MPKIYRLIRSGLKFLALIILSIMWIFPVYLLVIDGLKSAFGVVSTPIFVPASPSLSSYSAVFSGLATSLKNSVIVTIPVALISTFLGAMAAYYFYRVSSYFNSFLFTLIAIATFIPFEVALVPLIRLESDLGIFNSYLGLIFGLLVFFLPAGALIMSIFIPVLPKGIIESARIDGASDWKIFSRMVLPLTTPGLISTFVFIFIESWNNYFIPLVTTTTPTMSLIPIGLASYTGGYGTLYNESFAAGVISSIVPLLVFVFLSKYFIRGFMALGLGAKG
ncbi:alpha glucoside ABC transporter permease protein [Picrophilus oshimae DSM 9789]|uniref:Alpha glucoside ABC transporter permease protein n=1 Tax=Picrophilus torridus (strain ATCC 700027 / DSM 9790 / JCM 10055 / NBRC 100828 / KAW 2/3) TaxID=1122961 RepID=Q6KZ74_PICTO|nr:glucose ABC transporter permease GlcU [Picrophilus oshimae]AAT43978.1 alpha glucoside ABC transporter permease protein [Picrophilus oshimae DSM 9789]